MFQRLRSPSRSVALAFLAAVLACMPLSMATAATASRGDVVVATVHGTVSATMAGMTVPLSAGAILQLPATVRTGADGAVELRQGNSTFAAAGNTELEIPQSAAEDGLVERIIQVRGNAFYNIGKRSGTRLRVEAPYLVAVIKGTQFNIAAHDDSTTIALFEGHLEVRASDDSDVVDLDAGEIAIRRRNDVTINVLRLNAVRGDTRRNPELVARQQADSPTSDSGTTVARNGDTSAPRVDVTTSDRVELGNGVTPTERGRIMDTLETDAAVVANTEVAANVDARVSIDVPAGAVDVGVGVGEIASVDAGVGAAVDLSAGTVAASADVALDVGPVSTDVGVGAAVDVTAEIDVGASVAAADVVTVDTSVGAAADLPAGTVDVGVDTSVAAVGLPVDVGAGAAVDAAAGTVDVGVDTSLAGVDVGAAVGVDVGSGVSADVGAGPVDVGLDVGSGGIDLDLGLGASDDSANSGGLLGGLGGLLGGRKRD
jgi:hypothetical protein